MAISTAPVGTFDWVAATGGHLSRDERRRLLRPLASTHAVNAVGRASMLIHLNSGRRVHIDPSALALPTSPLTAAAEREARARLSPALLNHSYRTYAFGAALGALANIDVDTELLFAAAMLHDTGLRQLMRGADFTLASARIARDVAEIVGLSTAATDTLSTAITMHHSPGVTPADGPVAYLLSAGAGVDVIGLRSWKLPPQVLAEVVAQRPRLGFKREFTAAWREEAAGVPRGRAQLLRRYGAFDLAIKLAPFRS
ncbi:MAG: HD domain-containing protein [Actinomycetota bacterium]|nr:HD domain-containing protein [Actinomycetota bacterium]